MNLDNEKQRSLKGLSKAISIIATIMKVFCIIGIVGIGIAMSVVPLITSKITINDEQIIIFDKEFTYEINDNNFKLLDDDKAIIDVSVTKDFPMSKIKETLTQEKLKDLSVFSELLFVCLIAELVVMIILFNKVKRLFKNIHDEDSPFILENVHLLKKIGILLIISTAFPFVYNSILEAIYSFDIKNGFSIMSVIIILAVFAIMYVFEYGCALQAKSKKKIYGDIDE